MCRFIHVLRIRGIVEQRFSPSVRDQTGARDTTHLSDKLNVAIQKLTNTTTARAVKTRSASETNVSAYGYVSDSE